MLPGVFEITTLMLEDNIWDPSHIDLILIAQSNIITKLFESTTLFVELLKQWEEAQSLRIILLQFP